MTKFIIESDVPLPRSHCRNEVYPFRNMEIGQSFVFTGDESSCHIVRTAMYSASKRHSLEFTSRKIDGGIRIWRTA